MIAHAGKLWVMGCSASLWLASPSGRLQGQSYNNVCDSKLITHNSKLKSRKRESLTEFCFRMTLPSVLSPVSQLFYKCIGLRPYPYLISPIRTSPISARLFFAKCPRKWSRVRSQHSQFWSKSSKKRKNEQKYAIKSLCKLQKFAKRYWQTHILVV